VVSFDHVNHDILMGRVARVIRDKGVWQLMGKYRRRGAMADGLVEASVEGTPQGGRLSPLLANIYLDALDKEREKRGHCFCRYADDCNIYVGREASAPEGECRSERNGEGLGTQVAGVSTGSQEADRNRAGEPGKTQSQGTGDGAQQPEPQPQTTARRLGAIHTRLVGVLPIGPSATTSRRPRGMGPQAYPEMLLVEMARPEGAGAKATTAWVERHRSRGGDE
jgi:hypothetical protein